MVNGNDNDNAIDSAVHSWLSSRDKRDECV